MVAQTRPCLHPLHKLSSDPLSVLPNAERGSCIANCGLQPTFSCLPSSLQVRPPPSPNPPPWRLHFILLTFRGLLCSSPSESIHAGQPLHGAGRHRLQPPALPN